MELLDLVAIGTIADIAPLLGENHIFVCLGMQRLNSTQKPGLKALIRSVNLQNRHIRERDISFGIAPRINAAGRMKDASIAFELLVTDDEEEAAARVAELEQLNLTRQQETEALMKDVREQALHQPMLPVVLVNGDNWHEGLIGLVAGKLADEIKKPVLVLSNDQETRLSRGSARSQKGFNMIEALRGFAPFLERYGGHAQAAGFTIRSEHIEALHNHLVGWKENGGASVPAVVGGSELADQTGMVIEQESTESAESSLVSGRQMVDIVFTRMELINYELYKKLRMISPFGNGNPEPIFKMENLRLLDKWSSGANRQNLRLRLGATQGKAQQSGTLTRGATQLQSLQGVERVNVIFKLESMEDEAKQDMWLRILDVEPVNS